VQALQFYVQSGGCDLVNAKERDPKETHLNPRESMASRMMLSWQATSEYQVLDSWVSDPSGYLVGK
jgi:hypothetical protein